MPLGLYGYVGAVLGSQRAGYTPTNTRTGIAEAVGGAFGVKGVAGIVPAPRLNRIAGRGEILYSIYKLYILGRQLLGRHADERCSAAPRELL